MSKITRQRNLSNILFSADDFIGPRVKEFQQIIYDYYRWHKRDFPWRNIDDPYKILVSEFMLQQTQTDRVVEKYTQFISVFPTILELAEASFADILSNWSGLGYNRRALALSKCSEIIIEKFDGVIPDDEDILVTFPGIGPYTASAVTVFAYNKPSIMIETNIRSVFIYLFFEGKEAIDDKVMIPLVEKSLDYENPREWYYGLMDYGAMLKKIVVNPSRKSRQHHRQSRFIGSTREIRGQILRYLLNNPYSSIEDICRFIDQSHGKVEIILDDLIKDGLIVKTKSLFRIV